MGCKVVFIFYSCKRSGPTLKSVPSGVPFLSLFRYLLPQMALERRPHDISKLVEESRAAEETAAGSRT